MSTSGPGNNSGKGPETAPPPARTGVLVSILLIGVAVVGAVIALKSSGKKDTPPPDSAVSRTSPGAAQRSGDSAPGAVWTAPRPPRIAVGDPDAPPPPGTVAPAPPVVPPPPPRPEPTPYTRQLVATLAQLDLSQKQVTPEQAAAFKDTMKKLIERGGESAAAFREFLEQNKDVSFAGVAGASELGAPSLRSAMLGALAAIGGPEGVDGLIAALQNNHSPREIAQVAQSLDRLMPEQRQAAVEAARAALAAAVSAGKPAEDVGPLFQVLYQYGGPGVVADLEQYSQNWKYYSTIALANLPEGAGLPTLINMVKDPNSPLRGSRNAALQVLAQMAPQYEDAQKVLLEQARAGQIPFASWITIASVLGGHQFQIGVSATETASPEATSNVKTWHLTAGNQNFSSQPNYAGWTADQVQQRVALIDQLLAAAQNNPTVAQQLQQARAQLAARLQPTGQ